MSHIVALEFQHPDLLVTAARVRGNRLQIEHVASIRIADVDPVDWGGLLKQELAAARVGKSDAVGIIGREEAEVRELVVPPAPNDELPEMIRFQARSEFGMWNENWALDFVPLTDDASLPRHVLAAAVPPERLQQLNSVCDAAGLRLKHVLFRPYAAVDAFRPQLEGGEATLIVDHHGDRVDLTVSRGTRVLATRSVKPSADPATEQGAAHLVGEARRTVAAVGSRLEQGGIQQVLLCQPNPLLANQLSDRLGVSTETIVPFDQSSVRFRGNRPSFANQLSAIVGALRQQESEIRHEIDFLHPRKKVVKQIDYRRYGIIAAAATFGFLCLGLIGWWVLANQQAEIDRLRGERSKLEAENSGTRNGVAIGVASDQIIGEVTTIDEWKSRDLNWLEELYQISDRFLTPDDAIVDSFEARLTRDEPTITLAGRLAGANVDRELKTTLMERPFNVQAPKTAMIEDDTYPQSYEYVLKPEVDLQDVIKQVDELAREALRQSRQPEESDAADPGEESPETL